VAHQLGSIGTALAPPFLLARDRQPPAVVAEAVAALKLSHTGALTPQDLASLDYLLTSLTKTDR
jgi:hypothetical protein